jgi:hypothetical protein
MSLFRAGTGQKVRVFAFDSATGLPKTGNSGSITASISKDFGAFADLTDTSATEEDSTKAPGYYLFDISQTECTADDIAITGRSGTTGIVVVGAPARMATRPTNAGILAIDGSGRMDVGKVNGSATAASTMATAYGGIETGTAQSGSTSTTIKLRSGAPATDDIFKDQAVAIISGTGAGQTNRITAYVGSTKVATVETTWVTTPDNTSVYIVLGRIG